MDFINNIFNGDSEILFFILVFLFLFNGSLAGGAEGLLGDSSNILFFILVFLFLFFNKGEEAVV